MHVIKAIAWKCTGVKLFVMHLSCEDQEEDWVLCVKPRPRASLFKIVSRVSITSDIPDSPRAPFQVHSHGRCGDAYQAWASGQVQSQAGASLESLSEKMNRVVRWLSEPIQEMHELMTQLQTLVQTDSRYALMFFLLVESATNILNTFNAVSVVADAAQN